jgi:hypothetical protein
MVYHGFSSFSTSVAINMESRSRYRLFVLQLSVSQVGFVPREVPEIPQWMIWVWVKIEDQEILDDFSLWSYIKYLQSNYWIYWGVQF